MRRYFVTIFLIAINLVAFSQSFERCGIDLHSREGAAGSASFENWISNERASHRKKTQQRVMRLPVVVHVLHDGEALGDGANLSEEQIHQQIESLNRDFRRTNADAAQTRAIFADVVADTGIEFQLAELDPYGNATNGIVRHNLTDYPRVPYQSIGYWPAEDYINIWVMDFRTTGFAGNAVYPRAELPGLEDSPDDRLRDGITINAVYFGQGPNTVSMSRGRTLTHEMGHFLGLLHTWGKVPFGGNGCDFDDFCSDTPNSVGPSNQCIAPQPCAGALPAMVENFMDYADDNCMNSFTSEQAQRMRFVLENSVRRKSLIRSPGLSPADETHAKLSLFPNPARDIVSINLSAATEHGHLIVFDVSGRPVLKKAYSGEGLTIDLSGWAPGLYWIDVRGTGHRERLKLLVN